MSKMHKADMAISNLTLWGLLRTRVYILAFSIPLIAINRASGMVWPYLSKHLIDDVIAKHSHSMLVALVSAMVLATILQAVSGYLITRTVNPSAQYLVADLRKRIHYHISRLPLTYHDANKTGALVSRIMSDVGIIEGVINSGFISLPGAIVTACIALIILLGINPVLTLVLLLPLGLFG